MKRKSRKLHGYTHAHHHERPIRWLPIDSRFITPIFKFGSVKGVARLFLEIEITLAIFIVVGTLLWATLRVVSIVMPAG